MSLLKILSLVLVLGTQSNVLGYPEQYVQQNVGRRLGPIDIQGNSGVNINLRAEIEEQPELTSLRNLGGGTFLATNQEHVEYQPVYKTANGNHPQEPQQEQQYQLAYPSYVQAIVNDFLKTARVKQYQQEEEKQQYDYQTININQENQYYHQQNPTISSVNEENQKQVQYALPLTSKQEPVPPHQLPEHNQAYRTSIETKDIYVKPVEQHKPTLYKPYHITISDPSSNSGPIKYVVNIPIPFLNQESNSVTEVTKQLPQYAASHDYTLSYADYQKK